MHRSTGLGSALSATFLATAFCGYVRAEATPASRLPQDGTLLTPLHPTNATTGSSGTSAHRAPVDLVVVAPHPDDEVLLAGDLIAEYRQLHKSVAVVVVTNGDFTCARDGYRREDESARALSLLGVPEPDIHFLGYPDGHLRELGTTLLPPVERRDAHGACVHAAATYGHRGAGGTDEHAAQTGIHGPYTATSLVGDLAAILGRLSPRTLVVPHPLDAHPDHAMTYAFVRQAYDRLPLAPEHVLRAMVHAGKCWPAPETEGCPSYYFDPRGPVPSLPAPLTDYLPSERIPAPASMRRSDPQRNPKMRAIAAYRSQTGPAPTHNWLAAFVHSDEVFWPERWTRTREGPSGTAQSTTAESGTASTCTAPRWIRTAPVDGPPRVHHASIHFSGGSQAQLVFLLGSGAEPANAARDATGYELQIDAERSQLTLRHHTSIGNPNGPLRRWPLPPGALVGPHGIELSFDQRWDERGIEEISLWIDCAFQAIAIDMNAPPLSPGCTVTAENAAHALDCSFER